MRGLLWDLCGDYRKEVKLLVLVLREGVVAEMSSRPANIPPALLIARLTKHMQEELSLNEGSLLAGLSRAGHMPWVLLVRLMSLFATANLKINLSLLDPLK